MRQPRAPVVGADEEVGKSLGGRVRLRPDSAAAKAQVVHRDGGQQAAGRLEKRCERFAVGLVVVFARLVPNGRADPDGALHGAREMNAEPMARTVRHRINEAADESRGLRRQFRVFATAGVNRERLTITDARDIIRVETGRVHDRISVDAFERCHHLNTVAGRFHCQYRRPRKHMAAVRLHLALQCRHKGVGINPAGVRGPQRPRGTYMGLARVHERRVNEVHLHTTGPGIGGEGLEVRFLGRVGGHHQLARLVMRHLVCLAELLEAITALHTQGGLE